MTVYIGCEGVTQMIPSPPNVKQVYPLLRKKAAAPIAGQHITEEYERFLAKHEKVIVVSFGTTFSPYNETLAAIFNVMRERNDYGYILGLKGTGYFR